MVLERLSDSVSPPVPEETLVIPASEDGGMNVTFNGIQSGCRLDCGCSRAAAVEPDSDSIMVKSGELEQWEQQTDPQMT